MCLWEHYKRISVLLTAGQPSPAEGAPVQREGVALVLDGPGLAAWMCGRRRWKAVRITFFIHS